MNDLIKELEGATEGSRELDAEIYRVEIPTGAIRKDFAPHYTTSFDAAYTLIPKGWGLASLWSAVSLKDRPWWGVNLRQDDPYRIVKATKAKTPALALCIAALKARGIV